MTDLLFVTEAEEVTSANRSYRYHKMTTMYMNRLTIDLADNTEILGQVSLPFVFCSHADYDKKIDQKQQSKQYSDKEGFDFITICEK